MRKLLLILLSITLLTACDNESLDRDLLNNMDDDGGNTSDDPLALNAYSFDVNSTVPIFGTVIVNTDFSFNSNNKESNSVIASTFFGQTVTENAVINRDNLSRVTGYVSSSSGITTNEATVSYNGNDVSQIVYDYVGDDEDDYTYNFTYSGNMITRTEVGSTISTVFTLNSLNQLLRKESFDGTTSIKTEVLDYDGLGNCISSIITGEDATSSSFTFDTKDNPLKDAFSDQYLLSFLNDDYSDEVGSSMAQFSSPNNWIGITTPEGTVNFTVQYDAEDRITSRNGTYDLGDGVLIQQAETFQFVN
ncbi:MAG: hypothetical protein R2797_04505 [Gelidibacter sp.]